MNLGRFWGVFFSLMITNFVIRIFLKKKGIGPRKTTFCDKLLIAALPIFLFIMWKEGSISTDVKIIDTIIAIVSIVTGIGFSYLDKFSKKMEEKK